MPLVLLAVDEQVAVQLLDVVFGDRDLFPRPEHELHRFGVAGDLLLVAGGEGLDVEVGEQAFDLAVGELAALDPGGGADALDGRDAPQRRQPFGRDGSERPPGALELVDLGDQRQDLRGDPDGVDSDAHTRIDTQLHPNGKAARIFTQFHPIGPSVGKGGLKPSLAEKVSRGSTAPNPPRRRPH